MSSVGFKDLWLEDKDLTFKILTGKYDMRATPTMLAGSSTVTRGHNLRLNTCKFRVNMIYVNTILLVELLMYGI